MRFLLALIAVMPALLASPGARCEPLVISVYNENRGPLSRISPGGTVSGLYPDLFAAVLNRAGIGHTFRPVPQNRRRVEFANGDQVLDCCSNPAWRTQPREVAVQVFSDPIYETRDIFVFPKGKAFAITEMADLQTKSVAVVRGFGYAGSEWFGQRIDLDNEEALIKFVSLGRADVGISNDVIVQASRFRDRIEIGPIHAEASLHIRVHRSRLDLLDPINAAISSLVLDGTIEDLERKYATVPIN